MFCAYELVEKNPNLKVLLIDKGRDIYSRKCPVNEHKLDKCPVNKNGISGCNPACSITNGFGGAGAFSDGKFNITTEFGGCVQPLPGGVGKQGVGFTSCVVAASFRE